MSKKTFVEIIEFTDPVCTWCWGSEPVLRKLETHYEGDLKINFVMGGLVEDIRTFRDNHNDIGGDVSKDNLNIARHWLEASERHGMPVETKGFSLFSNEHPSTYPINIAYKAAQFQGEDVANKFLRRIRVGAAAEARRVNQPEVLIEIAQESGLNVAEFIKSFSDGTAEKAFREDLMITRSYKAFGFPSFIVRFNGKEVMLRGYQSFDAFKEVINYLSNGEVHEKKCEKSEENIVKFIRKFEHVASAEIAAVFDFSQLQLSEITQSLSQKSLIEIIPAGNGYFVTPYVSQLTCNPTTGSCNF